jgi:hypothetical protein
MEAQFQTRGTVFFIIKTVSIAWQQQPFSQKAIMVTGYPTINRKKDE